MASQHPFPATVDDGKLLTPKERKACLKICTTDDEITRKRAKALLALDQGYTQVKAGTLAGLTRGQVNYLVTLFRKKGMDLFTPDTEINSEQKKKEPAKSAKSKSAKKTKKKKSRKKEKKKAKSSAKKDRSKDDKKSGKKEKKRKKGKKK